MAPLIALLLKAGLPTLGKAILEKGKEWVEEKTGLDIPDLQTAELSPEQLTILREAEAKNKDTLTQAIASITTAEIGDIDSARKLQIAAIQHGPESWLAVNFVYLLASFWSIASCAYITFITFGNIPKGNERFADTILGFVLGTAIASIFSYFFGTTRSSGAKDGVVARLLDKLSSKD